MKRGFGHSGRLSYIFVSGALGWQFILSSEAALSVVPNNLASNQQTQQQIQLSQMLDMSNPRYQVPDHLGLGCSIPLTESPVQIPSCGENPAMAEFLSSLFSYNARFYQDLFRPAQNPFNKCFRENPSRISISSSKLREMNHIIQAYQNAASKWQTLSEQCAQIAVQYQQSQQQRPGQCGKKDRHACTSCEESLQDNFNAFLDQITQPDLSKSVHWGDLKDDLPGSGENIAFKGPRIKFEDALRRIIDMMRVSNDGMLNYVVIGESESLQRTSITDHMNPRIMLKSANSELMVTFSTDPNLPGYNSIEMMRWNAKEGRYEFQELNFGDQGAPPHVDLSGKKCMLCHKSPSMRPNWDTYRAWAGIVPSRDDMLEMHFYKGSGNLDTTQGMQPDARAYMTFLEQIADAKGNPQSGRSRRLAMLDIPFDYEDQLKEYIGNRNAQSLTPREQVAIIRQRIQNKGFYRIRHYPDKVDEQAASRRIVVDFKTAQKAGPSQFAFDQMLNQNMCRVATDLTKNPDFEEFKYALTGLIKCSVSNYEDLTTFFPQGHETKIKNYFVQENGESMREISSDERKNLSQKTPEGVYQMLVDDTANNHRKADGFKISRHSRFLENYLRSIENQDAAEAKSSAEYYSGQVVTPTKVDFHAAFDPGGVKGVEETDTNQISLLRFLLEPYGVDVKHWSLSSGRDNSYDSYSFSDQFILFRRQQLFVDIFDSVGNEIGRTNTNEICQEIRNRSIEALSRSRIRNNSRNCILTPPTMNESSVQLINIGNEASGNLLEQDAKNSLRTCVTCHGDDKLRKFDGLENFVNGGEGNKFRQFLTSTGQRYGKTYLEIMEYKLGVHGPHDYGADMPPGGRFIDDNGQNEYGHRERRVRLATYLINFSGVSSIESANWRNCRCNTP